MKQGPQGMSSLSLWASLKNYETNPLSNFVSLVMKMMNLTKSDSNLFAINFDIAKYLPKLPHEVFTKKTKDGAPSNTEIKCKQRAESSDLGRLAIVHDPEGKERVIAMLDYFSQFLLKPFHESLLNNL